MRRLDRIDWFLLLLAGIAVVMLVMAFAWPSIESWWHRPRPGMQVAKQFIWTVGENERKIRINYLLYQPEEYNKNKTWPLVVYLHGAGERGNNLEKVRRASLPTLAEQKRDFPFVMISPQCPKDRSWVPERVLALIEHICTNWSVDRQRIYLIGFSMGGFGTWRTAAVEPERFAAIVPIAGGGDTKHANRLVGLPIWAFHGDNDECVPLKASQEMVEAVQAAGENPKLTIFEQAGHGIPAMVFAKEDLWNGSLPSSVECQERNRPGEPCLQWMLTAKLQIKANHHCLCSDSSGSTSTLEDAKTRAVCMLSTSSDRRQRSCQA